MNKTPAAQLKEAKAENQRLKEQLEEEKEQLNKVQADLSDAEAERDSARDHIEKLEDRIAELQDVPPESQEKPIMAEPGRPIQRGFGDKVWEIVLAAGVSAIFNKPIPTLNNDKQTKIDLQKALRIADIAKIIATQHEQQTSDILAAHEGTSSDVLMQNLLSGGKGGAQLEPVEAVGEGPKVETPNTGVSDLIEKLANERQPTPAEIKRMRSTPKPQ